MLAIQEYNSQSIRIRKEDRYVCLTDMAKASGKRLNDWHRLKSSESYLATLSRSTGIPVDQLIEINESGGGNETRGTWGHPKVAIRFAQWCSDEFAVQVDFWIDELLSTGKVQLVQSTPQTYLEALKALVASEEEKERLANQNKQLAGQKEKLLTVVDDLFAYSSIIRIAKFNKVNENHFKWQNLKEATLKLKLEVKKAPCARYGTKNLYPHQAWEICYPSSKLPESSEVLEEDMHLSTSF